ncbi:MAG: hypothetical protein ABSF92_03980 [Candidatus Acidiferrales bacterium]
MPRPDKDRFLLAALLATGALWASSCAVPLGPGYSIEKQTVDVRFVPAPETRIEFSADYQLRNTGNQPLSAFELRLPPERRLRVESVSITWDGQAIPFERRGDSGGKILSMQLSSSWPIKQVHALHLQYRIAPGEANGPQLDFPADSFYLPPGVWLAALLPPPGTFASGGAPPKSWVLFLTAPGDFLVHATGELKRQAQRDGEARLEFEQGARDRSPFVMAGRYHEQKYRGSPYTVIIWRKTAFEPADAERLAHKVQQIAKTYDGMFGPRGGHARPVWIADSPVPAKWHDQTVPLPNGSLGVAESIFFPRPPPDCAFIHVSESDGTLFEQEKMGREIALSLAETWLGYGQGPSSSTLPSPMAQLPDYAAAVSREAEESTGGASRERSIHEALERVPISGAGQSAKRAGMNADDSLLFFYALEDKYGREHLHAALRHMVQARRLQTYEVQDLMAALEQETHQEVGSFFRLWLKHPGIPEEFRARYEAPAEPKTASEEGKK